jgi:hypothetical protein
MLIWWIVKDMETCTLGGVHLSGINFIRHRVFLGTTFCSNKKNGLPLSASFLEKPGAPILLRLRKWNGKMKMA